MDTSNSTSPCRSSLNTGLCTCCTGRSGISGTEAVLLSSSGNIRSELRFPNYSCARVRLQTFSGWIKPQSPESMVAAGFYFTNRADAVRCFVCGIGLQNWDPEDDPFVEHARWAEECRYILIVKGQEFIDLVQEAVHNYEESEQIASEPDVSHLQSNLQQLEVDSPFAAKAGGVHSAGSDTYPESTLREHPLLTTAAQSVLEMGYLPKYIKIALDRVLESKGWDSLTGEIIMEEIFIMEERGEIQSSPSSCLTTSSSSYSNFTSPDDMKRKIEEENQKIKDTTLCKICCEDVVKIVFVPCSHLVCCAQCSPAMKTCPLCRTLIKGRIRVSWT